MENPRSEATPLSDRLGLEGVVMGLVSDLAQLRAGQISVEDARVRAEMSKQILNGVRLVVNAQKFLEQRMPRISASLEPAE